MIQAASTELVRRIEAMLARPVHFNDVLEAAAEAPYRDVLRAWSEIRTRHELQRDELGRYLLPASDR